MVRISFCDNIYLSIPLFTKKADPNPFARHKLCINNKLNYVKAKPQKKVFLKKVSKSDSGYLKTKKYFKNPTAIKLEGGGQSLMTLPLRKNV